jgi:formylglycine-generating enzyme required for sulfatase activity
MCVEAFAPSNLSIIPPVNFTSDHPWVEVPLGTSDQQIKELIRKETARLIDSGTQPKKYEDIQSIFQNWMQEKQALNDLWKQRMLELGTLLRDQIAEVSRLRQESISKKNQRDVAQSQLQAVLQTLKNDSLSLQRYLDEKEFLKDNLEGQLQDISYMVVVLGRRQVGISEDIREVKDKIGDKMMVEAVTKVNGTYILAENTVQNRQLVRDYVKSVESGYAQVLDSYTNDFEKIPSGNIVMRYLVQAIEVSPFKSKESKTKTSKSVDIGTTAYIITRNNLNQIWQEENLADDRSKDDIKKFLSDLLDQSGKQNSGIDSKINKLYDTYQTRISEVEAKLLAVNSDILSHSANLSQYQQEYQRLKQMVDNYDKSIIEPAVETLKGIEKNYSDHYNLRIFLADKTEEGWGVSSQKQDYCNYSATTWDKMKEYKEAEYTSTVVAVNYQLDSYTETMLTYTPRVRAFTVLFLTPKELSTKVSYVACVGYQMELNPKTAIAAPSTTEGAPAVYTLSRGASSKTQGPISGMEFVSIPGGSFTMGSPSIETDRSYGEDPQHQVTIQAFYMMSTEVTQAQWKAVMGSNPSNFKRDNLPVESISWNDCQEFIKKLNQMDPGKGYRLPSEAEWEYACRAGTTTRFCSGNSESDLARVGWYSGNSGSKTHPVGTKESNAWGLYDMHGNVWEWCEDWFHDSYKGAPSDGSAWESGGGQYRVLRGGSWSGRLLYCRSAIRDGAPPDKRGDGNGLRLMRSQ